MANYFPATSGVWSNLSNWLTAAGQPAGILPMSADDVYSNNRVIYIDGNYQVNSIRNTTIAGISAGGYFVLNSGFTLSAFVYGGGVNEVACLQFLSAAPASATLVGNLCAGDPSAAVLRPIAFRNVSTGSFTIIGNCLGGFNNNSNADSNNANNGLIINDSSGNLTLIGSFSGDVRLPTADRRLITIRNQSTGTISISGQALGGSGSSAFGAFNNSTGTISISGQALGGSGSSATGAFNNSTGTISIVGQAIGGSVSIVAGAQNNSTGTISIVGQAIGGSGSNAIGAWNNSTGTISISGQALGGSGSSAYGAQNNSTGTISIVGQAIGGSGSSATGAFNQSTGTISISGQAIGGSVSSAVGAFNQSTGTISISGQAIGGSGGNAFGAQNNGTGTISIVGQAIGGSGSSATGAFNNSTGTIYATRVKGSDGGIISTGIGINVGGNNATATGQFYVEEFEFGKEGAAPFAGTCFIVPKPTNLTIMKTEPLDFDDVVLFSSLSSQGLFPPVSSVRSGTVYGGGDFTGTMIVPTFSAVQVGVPVDDKIGIFVLAPESFWQFPRSEILNYPNSIGYRIANLATIASVGQQIGSFNLYPPQSAFNIL